MKFKIKGKMMKKIAAFICLFLISVTVFAQQKISLKGIITDSISRKPVDMATVMILEIKTKTYTDEYGRYNVTFPSAGTYTIIVKSEGSQIFQEKIVISAPEERNIVLKPLKVQGGAITIKGDRDIQKISRHSLSNKEIKAIPAAFGDSLSALTALPNVMRTDGMFGPLVIRGASPNYNGYLVDNIPIYNPYHFGGMHSVINTNIIDEIDLYSSSFPAHFGNAQSAVINVNTVDEVKKFGGYADISMLYSSVVLKAPLKEKYYEEGIEKIKNNGYFIFAGRIGYISLFLKATKEIYEAMGKDVPSEAPQYGDYQIKIKRNINDRNSISFLAFGSFDKMKFVTEEDSLSESDDPYLTNIKFKESTFSHAQGITYTYTPNEAVQNKLLLYNSMMTSKMFFAMRDSDVKVLRDGFEPQTKPIIAGIKESVKVDLIKNYLQLKTGGEFTYYYFRTAGTSFEVNKTSEDLGDEEWLTLVHLGDNIKNQTISGFSEVKINFEGLEFVPGIRTEYLFLTKKTLIDPRGMIAYTFPSETTVSFAGGKYSYFPQLSSSFFQLMPHLSKAKYITPQYSYHSSAGIEQKLSKNFSVKMEGFYNYYLDQLTEEQWIDDEGVERKYKNCMKMRSYGTEFMIKKDINENENGIYGFINYTFDKSQYKTGAKNNNAQLVQDYASEGMYYDPSEYKKWIDSPYDMRHILKMVLAYKYERHTFSTRVQYNTSKPYTPINSGWHDTDFSDPKDPNHERWVPLFGTINSKRFKPSYQIDLRYEYRQRYEWGYFSWYLELINVTAQSPEEEKWDYRYGYSKNNPKIEKEDTVPLPNFGVEISF